MKVTPIGSLGSYRFEFSIGLKIFNIVFFFCLFFVSLACFYFSKELPGSCVIYGSKSRKIFPPFVSGALGVKLKQLALVFLKLHATVERHGYSNTTSSIGRKK